ncbi:MAG TPA: SdrD B-like domain-containing protein, partial [Candidatus Dojkabacteria bacterium]|nr:SdrD B-like domain-containing protein [Candidatus Dojkabacteria bacterium]
MGTISKTSSYTFNVFPGTYSFNETLPDGWSLVGNACTNITIGNGDSKDCTITNAKNGSLTIVKKALPASTDSFSFALMSGSTTINSFNLADNSDTTDASETFSLLPGNYSVSEGNYSNWGKTTSSCTNGNSVSSITLNSGDSVTCTFTNTKYGSISGYKINDADGNSGTTTDQSYVSGWNIELWDSSAERNKLNETVTSTDGKYTFTNILPGTYRVKEVLKAGWAVLTVSEQEVVVSAGENKTDVNFINYKEGSIKVVKNVDGNGDGDLNDDVDIIGATDWKWKLGSVEYSTGKTISNLRPGEYAISEVGKDNYHFVSLSCTGGADITISANEAKVNLKSGEEVTCTYTNARNLGKLIIVKKVINDNGGTRTAKEFSFKIDSENAQYFNEDNQNKLLSRMEFTRYSGLTHSITEVEANQYGYATTYNNCTNVTIPYNGEVTCEIVNDDVAPMLTVVTKVINDNGGNAMVSDFGVKLNGGVLTFGDGVTDTSTSTTVYTSTPAVKSNTEYSLSESDI